MRKVGVIGLGTMGMPMAKRLASGGYHVRGYDISTAAREAFASVEGATCCGSAAAVASDADAVILMLMSSDLVEATVDEGGLLEAMRPGSVLIDMGSSNPVSSLKVAARAKAAGVRYVDAPVSGGGHWGAEAGTMTIMVGGDDADVAGCMSLFERLGTTIRHVGPPAAGHAIKAINNLLSGVTLLASSEALDLGQRFGLDPELMLEVINASSGQSDSTTRKLPRFVVTKSFDSGGPLTGMVKDMNNATALADHMGVNLRLGAVATELWKTAAAEMPADADYTEIALWTAGAHLERQGG